MASLKFQIGEIIYNVLSDDVCSIPEKMIGMTGTAEEYNKSMKFDNDALAIEYVLSDENLKKIHEYCERKN